MGKLTERNVEMEVIDVVGYSFWNSGHGRKSGMFVTHYMKINQQ